MRHTMHKPAAFAALRLCARNPTHRSFRHGAHGTARRQSGVSAFSLSAFGRSAWSAYSAVELRSEGSHCPIPLPRNTRTTRKFPAELETVALAVGRLETNG